MIKSILSALVLTVVSASAFAADKPSELTCVRQARNILSHETKHPVRKIAFFNGAAVGDAAVAMEVLLYTVREENELVYKVEVNAEDCSLRNIEQLDI
jgi:hypothetical protein